MLGIGVTTFRRPEMVKKCWEQLVKHMPAPDGFQHFIHDDSETELGVAASKNACIANLMSFPDVDHIFLFDDDAWPIEDNWWKPYVESGVHHLSWNWMPEWDTRRDCWPIGDGPDYPLTGWNTSCGCMLYYTREALQTAGGMRTQFGKWGFEHMEHSYRIHKLGLTPEPFISLSDQRGIYSVDQHNEDHQFTQNHSSITGAERRQWYARNVDFYKYWIEQEPRFVPYE